MTNLSEFRQQKDTFFKSDHHSPLAAEEKEKFQGLNYYPDNPHLRFDTVIELENEQVQVEMQTSTGDLQQYVKLGKFQFEVDGELAELTVYSSLAGGLFVPFVDATSGKETYGAGRYLEIEQLDHNLYRVDFNLAYNPWCAYSPFFSCPIPPQENRLKVPIRAGEKNYYQDLSS